MKNSEEAIERVLAGLRESEAPAGMERRILGALAMKDEEPVGFGWRRWRPIWLVTPGVTWSLACGAAVASVLIVALAIPAVRRLGHGPVQSVSSPVAVGSLATAAPVAPEIVVKGARVAGHRSSVRAAGETATRRSKVVQDRDSAAPDEVQVASYPAPPLPLTEQEKLLLKIVHKGDPQEVAMLDPTLRAKRDSEEKADVKRFFEPSTRGDNE